MFKLKNPVWFSALGTVLLVSGCGVEVATTAATTGKLKAVEVEQAKNQPEQFRQKLNEARQNSGATRTQADQ